MTWKQIEASREARLWIGQVIVPAVVGIMAVSPEARQTVKKQMRAGQKYDSPQTGEEGLMLLFLLYA